MDKFKGMLLCSDIDGTLVVDGAVPQENIDAIRYFQSEGGLFTIASGRIPCSIARFLNGFQPDTPIISHNGAAIYDLEKDAYIWSCPMPEDGLAATEKIAELCPYTGIEIYRTDDIVYICRDNDAVARHLDWEKLDGITKGLKHQEIRTVPQPWLKVVLVQETDETALLRKEVEQMDFGERFTFVQSAGLFYEILNREANKGNALLHLAKELGIRRENTIAIGDNENDLAMLQSAGLGIAVGNARKELQQAADYVTVSYREAAIAKIIWELDQGVLPKGK